MIPVMPRATKKSRWTGLASAMVHFCFVENRPLFLMSPALDTVAFSIVKRQYFLHEECEHHKKAVSFEFRCPLGASITEFDKMMMQSLFSLDQNYSKEGKCVDVEYEGKNYGTFCYMLLRWLLLLVFAVSIFQFIVAASKCKGGFSFWSGDYLAFTIKREDTRLFRFALFLFVCITVFVVYCAALLVSVRAVEENENMMRMLWIFFYENISAMLGFLVGFYLIMIPVDSTGMEELHPVALSQVMFKRPWYGMFYQSNDFLYQRLMIAGLADFRGHHTRIAALCDDPQSANFLKEAFKGDPAPMDDVSRRLIQ